jgi:hypothetical protein
MISEDDIARLTKAISALPAGPWEVWTSNSYRRITACVGGRSGPDGGVLHAYRQRSDGHPDLSMTAEQLRALCDLRNTVAELLAIDGRHSERGEKK